MDTLLLVVSDQLRARVVGVQFDLVDGGDGLAGGITEEFFEIFDGEVGYPDVADFARGGELLHFLPELDWHKGRAGLTGSRAKAFTMF